MNSLRLLRGYNRSSQMKALARYGKPLNRWQYVKIIDISITPTKMGSSMRILIG